jgi:hypothetical protein
MPEDHQYFNEWRRLSLGRKRWVQTDAVKAILASHKIEQQGYRSCMALLKLADRYSVTRLEAACTRALSYTPSPSYKNISTILKSGQDKISQPPIDMPTNDGSDQYGFTRGANYYGEQP